MVKVRFAPSPTGFLHIGSARTALFNWFFARNKKGKFVLRIEDTDRLRSEKKYLDEILESLKWLGLDWDEIVYQSQRFDIYREHAQKLLKVGKAYEEKTKTEDGQEKTAIIFKVQPQKIKINDVVRGVIEFDTETIKDQVLIKSDQTPTYNFACVVDDALLGITHVMRGEDHISNTPKQVMLYEALSFKLPEFVHIPLILGRDRSRMSKRHGATSIAEYKKEGYLKEALVNYISLLGWSPGDNREIMPLDEIIKSFSVEHIGKTGAVFDIEKLSWMNGEYIMSSQIKKLLPLIKHQLAVAGFNTEKIPDDYLIKAIGLYQIRIKTLKEFILLADYLFTEDFSWEEKGKKKYLENSENKGNIKIFADRLEKLEDFSHQKIEEVCRNIMDEGKLKASGIIHPTRVAISGKTKGAGLFETIELLGKKKTIARINKSAENNE